MAKFSDLFGRKGDAPSRPGVRQGNGTATVPPSMSNILRCRLAHGRGKRGPAQLAERHGRKIGELDELKDAFDKIVQPFNLDAAGA